LGQIGWRELEYGALPREAEAAGFDVRVTSDKNLSYLQNLRQRLDFSRLSRGDATLLATITVAKITSRL
jgi:hypothetical protein